ncbi:FAD-binding and (Fe-S)-binding domain-containing protein [Acidicapsa acidisoli]|uniref:FAD-binding and (Fe-S)-binding domain-containing protein n=1 Tax=Acidicapsa acidisoli TaxID=1615681 RepID=UPI0021E0B631|nr:FAD-binding and (Fe-S)-binding domain-containing protein [Acidicapsa acidisoli]
METSLESASQIQIGDQLADPTEIRQLLQELIDPDRILIRPIERIAFASDASCYRLIPRAVIQPKTAEEIKHLFLFSHEHEIPLVFRAGGTSLSGQAITDGILVDIGRYWRNVRVEKNGQTIRVQPGLIGQQANNELRLYGRKIGPDPASIASCRMGGILSNNSSGMCCGVVQNAYHTLSSLTFILPSGTQIDTADLNADNIFHLLEPQLCKTLLKLKTKIEGNTALATRIRSKYKTKNTTGYSLNAFLDFDRAIDIFSHLIIGSEGTLAFIAEAVLKTVPDYPLKSTSLLLFPDLYAACSAIGAFTAAGAAALEVMDRASLRSVESQPGIMPYLKELPDAAAGLLVEFQAPNEAQRRDFEISATAVVATLTLQRPAEFTSDPVEQAKLWKIRKGMFPSVGAVRAAGTTALMEDIAIPVDRLAEAATDLRALFSKHGYDNAIIFGHAKDGNLHFVLTQGFNTEFEIGRYREFMDDVVEMVVGKYDGALKAEHGTGRNMAPFVETEWGPDAYRIMQELKAVTDPHNLLNPGVIVNADPLAHVSDLKQMPVVEPEVDKCIECGFCEHSCPSRDLTLTPRQRIVVRREMQRLKDSDAPDATYAALDCDFPYMALDTCAADGLCATDCPVQIDTGKLTKRFRTMRHSPMAAKIAETAARNFALAEFGARFALAAGHLIESTFGPNSMTAITRQFDRVSRKLFDAAFWKWSYPMPKPRRGKLPVQPREGADAVYYPACISRIMGALPGESEEPSNMQALLNIAGRAKIHLHIPRDLAGHCCGVPFSSKGFDAANNIAVNHTIESFYRWSDSGRLPILIDTSPCTYGLKTCRPQLTPENQQKFDKLRILDSVEYAQSTILPKLPIVRKLPSVALHPVCSASKMGIATKLTALAQSCSEEVVVPMEAGCCAFAGDRGFLHPELTASATQSEAAELESRPQDGYFSSSRTCEIGMTRATGKLYRSYLHLLDFASRP